MQHRKIDLLSLAPDELEKVLSLHFDKRDQPSYRVRQTCDWIFEECVTSIDEMTNLPQGEREALASVFILEDPIAEQVAQIALPGAQPVKKR